MFAVICYEAMETNIVIQEMGVLTEQGLEDELEISKGGDMGQSRTHTELTVLPCPSLLLHVQANSFTMSSVEQSGLY